MAGVWSKLSDLWEYRHTEGDHSVLPRGKSINLSREKLRKPEPSKRVYEEVALEDVLEECDHIVVYNHGMKKIVDSAIPELSKKASQWDHVTQFVLGFTSEMLVVVDLMYCVEYHLTKRLNSYLEAEGLGAVDHVMQAVNRSKMKDKFFHKNEKKTLKVALKNFFTAIGGNNVSWEVLMSQWKTCRDWQCSRVTVAHPLENLGSLDEVKSNISCEKGYEAVREIALVMVDVAIREDCVTVIQGCKDAMCILTELQSVRKKMTVKSEVHAVEDGDHSLKISKKLQITQDASDQKALNQMKIFISKVLKKT